MTANTMPRFEPMTVGMLLDATVRLYAQNIALMLAITACAYLPFLALLLVITFIDVAYGQSVGALAEVGNILVFLLWYLVAQPLSIGAVTYAISERYLQRQSSVGGALHAVWKRYGTLLWAQSVVGIIVAFGFLLLLIPGIVWMLSYALVTPVIMLESRSARDSRQRSWHLVAGYRTKVLCIIAVVWLLTLLVTGGIGAIMTLLWTSDSVFRHLTSQLVNQLASYVIIPVAVIAYVLLYYDLRMRKEGFDLEMLSRALAQKQG
jgi:hypothetical protein